MRPMPDRVERIKTASPPGPLSGIAIEGEIAPNDLQGRVPLSNMVGEGDLGGEARKHQFDAFALRAVSV